MSFTSLLLEVSKISLFCRVPDISNYVSHGL